MIDIDSLLDMANVHAADFDGIQELPGVRVGVSPRFFDNKPENRHAGGVTTYTPNSSVVDDICISAFSFNINLVNCNDDVLLEFSDLDLEV